MTDEERFMELELKLMRQEDLAQDLSQTVYLLQKQVDELRALCKALAGRLSDSAAGADAYTHEKPPHY